MKLVISGLKTHQSGENRQFRKYQTAARKRATCYPELNHAPKITASPAQPKNQCSTSGKRETRPDRGYPAMIMVYFFGALASGAFEGFLVPVLPRSNAWIWALSWLILV
jgi:hypothetical protein